MRISDWSSDVCLPIYGPKPVRRIDFRYCLGMIASVSTFGRSSGAILLVTTVIARITGSSHRQSDPRHRPQPPSLEIPDACRRTKSAERREGYECVNTCRSRWCQEHAIQNRVLKCRLYI